MNRHTTRRPASESSRRSSLLTGAPEPRLSRAMPGGRQTRTRPSADREGIVVSEGYGDQWLLGNASALDDALWRGVIAGRFAA